MHLMRWTKEAKDTVWLMGLQGVNYIVPILVWPYLMVVLGAEQFGVFSFGMALAQYLMLIVDFGFNLTATKQIALAQGNQREINRVFSATMAAKMCLLVLTALVVAVVNILPAFTVYRKIIWITWLMVVGNTFSMFWLFQGMGKVRWVAITNAVIKLCILPLTFVLVKTPADSYIAAWIQVAIFIGAGAVTVGMMCWLGMARPAIIQWKDVKEQLRGSWSIFLGNAATSVYTTLFVVILAYFVSSDEVGRYAAAEKIMRCAGFVIWIPFSQAYFPRVSRLSAENRMEGERLVSQLTWLVAGGLTMVGVLLAIGAEPVAAWLGKDYGSIRELEWIMAVVPVMVGIGGIQGQMGLIAMGGERDKRAYSNVYLAAGLIALGSVCVLSYLWGTVGAAIALVLTEGFVCVSMCILNKKRKG